MLDIIKNSATRNGNGSAVGGRGLLRRRLTRQQRISLAADLALGLAHIEPSMKQSAATVGVRPDEVRAELKMRTKAREAMERADREAAVLDEAYAVNMLIEAWRVASPKAREVAVQTLGGRSGTPSS